ncbi:HAD-IIB family hydrolase [Microlunatus elymi]|uniref:HAD-IIB family hydrolase n=1 Tax=Microlunatus elymi TaxID=2596828 RepID=UPI00143D2038|nr:HAD family hydrolase [Microlunatus elymi]
MTSELTTPRPVRTKPPRLIVSDLDGTFLSPDGTVSERNVAAVRAAEDAGIPVVFATGRPIRFLEPIRGLRRTHAIVIASNGAMTYDVGRDLVLSVTAIDHRLAAEAFSALRGELDGIAFGVDSGARAGYEQRYVDFHGCEELFIAPDDPHRYVGELPELVADGDFVKLLVLQESGDVDRFTAEVARVLGDRLTATHSSPTRPLVEVSAAGVSKAATLARLCDQLGVPAADVAAFGDMPNDLEMLRWVGMPHVMAHGHPDLLDLDAEVIGSNADSAVGATIETWL